MAGPQRLSQSASDSAESLRTPPHSIEAEQAVLGGLLLDTNAWDQVGDSVSADDFYRPDHRLIFDAICALAGESKPCDVVTVSEYLERRARLDDAGGLAYLGTLARDTPTAANVRAYAQIVKERALLRGLISAGTSIVSSVFNDEGLTARELVNLAEQKVFEIAERGLALLPQNLGHALDALAADPVITAALGPLLSQQFIDLKRDEFTAHARHVSDWELHRYAATF